VAESTGLGALARAWPWTLRGCASASRPRSNSRPSESVSARCSAAVTVPALVVTVRSGKSRGAW